MVETNLAQFLSSLTPVPNSPENKTENQEARLSEIESLGATLQADEYKTHEQSSFTLVEFSVIPALTGKINAKNLQKKYTADFRSLPAFEFTLALSDAYPGQEAPHIMVTTQFYQPYVE